MTVIKSPKNKSRKITPFQAMMILVVVVCFYIFLQNMGDNFLYDYDAVAMEFLQKEGYNIKINKNDHSLNNNNDNNVVVVSSKEESSKQQQNKNERIEVENNNSKMTTTALSSSLSSWPSPIEIMGENAILKMEPILGKHRPDRDAIFSFARGLTLDELIRFVGSLLHTGYDGDIVLAVEPKHDLSKEKLEYLEYHSQHSNVIVYSAELVCKRVLTKKRCKVFKMFLHKEINGYLPDPRPHREVTQLRFEYYWAWSTLYSPTARIFLLDSRDLMFQLNPFTKVPSNIENKIMVFEESNLKQISDEPNNRLWLREGHQRKYVQKLGKHTPISAGIILGGQAAIETFGRAMIYQWDTTQCKTYGCDQGHVNFLVHGNFLLNSSSSGEGGAIEEVTVEKFGESFVMSLGLQMKHGGGRNFLRKTKFVDETNTILNQKGEISAIVHQFDQDKKLRSIFDGEKTTLFVKDWETIIKASSKTTG